MISFAHVEGAPVYLNAFDDVCDIDVRIGIAITMRIRRKVVGHKVGADLDELGDGFTVIAGDSRCEILRSFYAARGGLNGVAGYGYGRARAAGIGINKVFARENFFGWVGGLDVDLGDVRSYRDGVVVVRKFHADLNVFGASGGNAPRFKDVLEARGLRGKGELSGRLDHE